MARDGAYPEIHGSAVVGRVLHLSTLANLALEVKPHAMERRSRTFARRIVPLYSASDNFRKVWRAVAFFQIFRALVDESYYD